MKSNYQFNEITSNETASVLFVPAYQTIFMVSGQDLHDTCDVDRNSQCRKICPDLMATILTLL